MWLARSVAIAALAFLSVEGPSVAAAHGPCNCIFPQVAEAGEKIRITSGPFPAADGQPGTPAYRVIFNPEPKLVGSGGFLGGAYRAGEPTLVVNLASRRTPTHHGFFMAPRVAPGVYLVAIYDGSEGGGHFTWDYLHLIRATRGQGTTMAEWQAAMRRAITLAPDETYEGHGARSAATPAPAAAAGEGDDDGGVPAVVAGIGALAVAAGGFAAGASWRGRRRAPP